MTPQAAARRISLAADKSLCAIDMLAEKAGLKFEDIKIRMKHTDVMVRSMLIMEGIAERLEALALIDDVAPAKPVEPPKQGDSEVAPENPVGKRR